MIRHEVQGREPDLNVILTLQYLPGSQVQRSKLRIVIKHFLEVRLAPPRVYGITEEPSIHMLAQAAPGHRIERAFQYLTHRRTGPVLIAVQQIFQLWHVWKA